MFLVSPLLSSIKLRPTNEQYTDDLNPGVFASGASPALFSGVRGKLKDGQSVRLGMHALEDC